MYINIFYEKFVIIYYQLRLLFKPVIVKIGIRYYEGYSITEGNYY